MLRSANDRMLSLTSGLPYSGRSLEYVLIRFLAYEQNKSRMFVWIRRKRSLMGHDILKMFLRICAKSKHGRSRNAEIV